MAHHRQVGLVGTGIHKYYNFHNSCYSFSTSIEELQLLASNKKKDKKIKEKAHSSVHHDWYYLQICQGNLVEPTAGRYPS